MEVLASTNRMNAITFLSLYFLESMAQDYSVNTKGPAIEETWEFIIMHILTFMFIVLFAVPFKTYFIYILRNLHQLHILVGIFLQPLCIGHKIIGLYQAAREAGKFQVPAPKTQEKKLKGIKYDNCWYHCHEMCTSRRTKHDIR